MSTTHSTDWRQSVTNHYAKLGKLTQFARLIGLQNLQSHQREQALNREAESKAVRRQWIGKEADQMQADDMGHNILGDVTTPPPVIVAGGGDSGLKTLLIVGLTGLMGIGGAGLGAAVMHYMSQKPDAVQVQPGKDVSIGLGRIEDYLKD